MVMANEIYQATASKKKTLDSLARYPPGLDPSRPYSRVSTVLQGNRAAKTLKLELHKMQWDVTDVITPIKTRLN